MNTCAGFLSAAVPDGQQREADLRPARVAAAFKVGDPATIPAERRHSPVPDDRA